MDNTHILIVGGGAAGLMAAHTLANAGKKVTILESRDRCGGRIHTLNNELFSQDVELGAEFIHGDAPVTMSLLKEAGITYHPAGGEMWHYRDGKFDNEGGIIEGWGLLAKKLKAQKKDISINQFLEEQFPGEKYNDLKTSVRRFASGYDTADPDRASTFALRTEWLSEDDDVSHRVIGGYGKMISYLENEIKKAGGDIFLNSIVKELHSQPGKVKAVTEDGTAYEAEKVIIALPLGVLQVNKNDKAAITFTPQIPKHIEAINKIGFGAITKILLEFDGPFWEDKQTEVLAGKSLNTMAFLISDQQIPTWWTQLPKHSPVLTGWLAGGLAEAKNGTPDDEILKRSLQSLSNIFKLTIEALKQKLLSSHIVNWTNEPFTLGSYAYDTVETHTARKMLEKPIADTVFFAGEYMYKGPAMGTVEAALWSGEKAANMMITV